MVMTLGGEGYHPYQCYHLSNFLFSSHTDMSLSSFPNVAILKHIHKGSFYGIETLFDLEEETQCFIVSMHIHQ